MVFLHLAYFNDTRRARDHRDLANQRAEMPEAYEWKRCVTSIELLINVSLVFTIIDIMT